MRSALKAQSATRRTGEAAATRRKPWWSMIVVRGCSEAGASAMRGGDPVVIAVPGLVNGPRRPVSAPCQPMRTRILAPRLPRFRPGGLLFSIVAALE